VEAGGEKAGDLSQVLGGFAPRLEEVFLLACWYLEGVDQDDSLYRLGPFLVFSRRIRYIVICLLREGRAEVAERPRWNPSMDTLVLAT